MQREFEKLKQTYERYEKDESGDIVSFVHVEYNSKSALSSLLWYVLYMVIEDELQ